MKKYIMSSSTHMTKAVFDSLVVEVVKKCDEVMEKKTGDGHVISAFVAGWAAKHGLTAHEMPNVFRVISGTFTSNSQVYLASNILDEMDRRFEEIKKLVAEAVEHDKVHFARMKLEAIADAAAAALAFN